ncbi:hypothetical protein VTP01DRAFT_7785 [Rhizomucor pusillus]|uniref:uncharacterized protein n=1 Tax=Rhizomucor pusillus TaxID=4840 RepID=UPI0037446B32
MEELPDDVTSADNLDQQVDEATPMQEDVADATTNGIIRVNVNEDTLSQEFDDVFRMKTVASVARITKPWFYSGRTVIAHSWFGSPTTVRELKAFGLYSIMQLKTRRYWARGMPENDTLNDLGSTFGSFVCSNSTVDDVYVTALRDRQPKVVISNCSATTRSDREIKRDLPESSMNTIKRPIVFDEYEANKDGKSEFWHSLAIAFSAYTLFAQDEHDTLHGDFRFRLGITLLSHAQTVQQGHQLASDIRTEPESGRIDHKRVSLGQNKKGHYRKRVCLELRCRKNLRSGAPVAPTWSFVENIWTSTY